MIELGLESKPRTIAWVGVGVFCTEIAWQATNALWVVESTLAWGAQVLVTDSGLTLVATSQASAEIRDDHAR